MTVVEDLQQHVEDVGVGFLDLVEQDQAVAAPAHEVGELAAVVVADVARGEPTSLETVCFSMNSDMSRRTMLSLEPNMNSESVSAR